MSAQISLSAQRFLSAFVSRISRCVRVRLVCLPLCVVLLGCLVPVARAATDTVTNLNDSGPGSLRDTIANAAAGDTIVFQRGVTGTITLLSTLTISENLTIQGPGAGVITVSGNHAVGVFKVGNPTKVDELDVTAFSVSGLTIANGNLTVDSPCHGGAGISAANRSDNTSLTLSVSNSTFSGSSAKDGSGGAICSSGSMIVTNSSFFGNSSQNGGGAIYAASSLTVTNSTFFGNSAGSGAGGAIYAGPLEVINSSFSGNSAPTDQGGAIFSGQTLLSNNIFSGNSAPLGGGVVVDATNSNASNNVFYNNSNGDCIGCTSNTNEIAANPMLLPLGNYGGPTQTMLPQLGSSAICAGSNALVPTGTTTDQRGFPLNAACVDAGAVQTNYLTVTTTEDPGSSGTSLRAAMTVANSAGFADIAFQSGLTGTISPGGPLPTLAGQINIIGPGASRVIVSGEESPNETLFNIGSNAVAFISGLAIAHGNSDIGAGGIFINGGTLTLSNCVVSGNSSNMNAGGINNNGGTLTLSNCTISGNSSQTSSGGIFNDGGTLTISNSTVSDNSSQAGVGGGITNDAGTLTVSNSTFENNSAIEGGGIDSSGTLTVRDSTFSGNAILPGQTFLSAGGGILNHGALVVSNSIFAGNTAAGTSVGAGIYSGSGTTNASNDVFFHNLDANSTEDDCNGCTSNSNPIAADPMLAALGNYGGPTQTMLPLPGSSAICAGSAALVPTGVTTDQRGFPFVSSRYGVSSCVDAGAVQTNYTSIQFSNSLYSGFPNTAVSPAPIVSVTENGQNIGGVPVTLGFGQPWPVSGLGPVATTAGVGATFDNLKVGGAITTTLSAALQITPTFTLTAPTALVYIDVPRTTIRTSPEDLLIFIDGTSFNTTQTETWNVPSQHTLSVSSIGGDSATRFNFVQWNDGSSALSRTISAVNGNTSYIADYSTSYKLTVSSSGNGSVTPGSATFFLAGTVVNLTATPDPGYYFTGWAGSNDIASTSGVNTTIAMNGPETITASFAPLPNFVVTTTADLSDASCTTTVCSLRDAITAANLNTGGSANIGFTAGLNGTITLGSALPALNGQVSITGPVAGSLVVSGNNDSNVGSVFTVSSGATVAIAGLTIANGKIVNTRGLAPGGGIHNSGALTLSNSTLSGNTTSGIEAQGGAIFNEASGTLTVVDSTFSGNSATGTGSGGAIFNNAGAVTVNDSTFSGNSASNNGGGIFNAGALILANNIFSGNTAASIGGGIANNGGENETANISYTVFFHNTSGSGEDDCNSCTTNAHAISGDPMLAALGSYGGFTQTLLPLPGSSAICAGLTDAVPAGLTIDQRGLPRLNGGLACVDVGAMQTNYMAVKFSSAGYSGTPSQAVSPAPVVSVVESGQSIGGIPITLSFTGAGTVTGLGPVTTVAGTGAAYNSLSVDTAGSDTLLAMVQIAPGYTLSANVPLDIALLPQAINFTQPPSPVTYGVTPIALSAIGGASGKPVIFGVTGSCSVLASTVTITGAGSCDITANQAGNATYSAATPVQQTITINPAVLTVTAASPSIVFGAPVPAYTASIAGFVNGDASSVVSGAPSLTTSPSAPSDAGSYTITASLGTLSAANYSFIFVNGTLSIGLAAQTIHFTAPTSPATYGVSPITLTAIGGASGNAVTFSTTPTSPCFVSSNTLTITGAGNCVITASQLGNTDFADAPPVSHSITVNPAASALAIGAFTPVSPIVGNTVTFSATVSSSAGTPAGTVTFSVDGVAQTPVAATGGSATENIAGLTAGQHTIGAVFASSSSNFAGATASTVSLTVGAGVAPNAPPILLITTVTYTKLPDGSYQGVVTVTNQGSATAPNVVMTAAKLGAAVGTPAPQTLGNIPSGDSVVKTITYPATAGASKALAVGQILGTYTGGSFGGSQRVTLP